MDEKIKTLIEHQINASPIVLYMKGTKGQPMCGFSAAVVKVLNSAGADFKDINVLEDDDIREGIKTFSDWPTIPQLYVNGEFTGGCDIVCEMAKNGELAEILGDL